MPLSLSDVQTELSSDSVRAVVEQILTCLQFPVTAWQAESNARAFVELASRLAAEQSKPVAEIAKMVHTDTAEDEFLDAKMKSDYDELRAPAVSSAFNVRFVNSGSNTYPVAPSQIVVRAKNARTFSNTTTGGTLTAGTTQTIPVAAEVAGSAGNIPAQELELVTPFAGVRAFFDGVLLTAGADKESDANARSRVKAKWATLRTEKISAGILNLSRAAAPGLTGIQIDDDNPRGPGTVDVYLAADTATAGVSDVAAVQAALDGALFGTGTAVQAGLAIAAPTSVFNLAATVYTRGVNETDTLNALVTAWRAFLLTVPVGGFDLSPGPSHIIQREQITTFLNKAVPGVVSITITTPSVDTTIGDHDKVLEGSIAFSIVPVAEG